MCGTAVGDRMTGDAWYILRNVPVHVFQNFNAEMKNIVVDVIKHDFTISNELLAKDTFRSCLEALNRSILRTGQEILIIPSVRYPLFDSEPTYFSS